MNLVAATFLSVAAYAAGVVVVCISGAFGDDYVTIVLGSLAWPVALPIAAAIKKIARRRADRNDLPRATARMPRRGRWLE